MVKFRQKLYVAPAVLASGALNTFMVGSTVLGMKQSSDQAKEQEAQMAEQKRAIEKQTKALNRIANEAKKNPQIAQQVVQEKQMSQKPRIKLFAGIVNAKNLKGFAKDLWKTQKGNAIEAAKVGIGFAGMGYLGNRAVQSMYDHDTGHDEKNKNFLKKAALTTAGIGGTYLAAKYGMLGKKPMKFLGGNSISQATKNSLDFAGKAVKEQVWGDGLVKKGVGAAFVAAPMIGYLGKRKQIKEQAQQSQQQQPQAKTYSDEEGRSGSGMKKALLGVGGTVGAVAMARHGLLGKGVQRYTGSTIANIGGFMRSAGAKKLGSKVAGSGSKTYVKGLGIKEGTPEFKKAFINEYRSVAGPNKISGAVNKASTFFGWYGKGGTEAVQNTARSLSKAESGSEISKKVGDYLKEHKTTANLLATGGTLAVGGAIGKVTGAIPKAIDKQAYEYENLQNQEIK